MSKERIARRVARDLNDGDVVNLGIGLPTMVADYVPEGIEITLQSENGILGMGPLASSATANKHLIWGKESTMLAVFIHRLGINRRILDLVSFLLKKLVDKFVG